MRSAHCQFPESSKESRRLSPTIPELEALCAKYPKFLRKGGLCVALVVTKTAKVRGLPLNPELLKTEEGGQVAGLGKAAVQTILAENGVYKVLAEEGGRTSRGSLGLMGAYVECLNQLCQKGAVPLDDILAWWLAKVRAHFASEGPKFHFDTGKSLRANIEDLLKQARELQAEAGGANYLGAMLQHLVGAKLDTVLGKGMVQHYGSSVADRPTERKADFQIEAVAIHVTTTPSEALIGKCAANLQDGLKPVVITNEDGVSGAAYLLRNANLMDRVDVLDIGQFLTANIYERSMFKSDNCRLTFSGLLLRYNEIVAACERDPCLLISLGALPSSC